MFLICCVGNKFFLWFMNLLLKVRFGIINFFFVNCLNCLGVILKVSLKLFWGWDIMFMIIVGFRSSIWGSLIFLFDVYGYWFYFILVLLLNVERLFVRKGCVNWEIVVNFFCGVFVNFSGEVLILLIVFILLVWICLIIFENFWLDNFWYFFLFFFWFLLYLCWFYLCRWFIVSSGLKFKWLVMVGG